MRESCLCLIAVGVGGGMQVQAGSKQADRQGRCASASASLALGSFGCLRVLPFSSPNAAAPASPGHGASRASPQMVIKTTTLAPHIPLYPPTFSITITSAPTRALTRPLTPSTALPPSWAHLLYPYSYRQPIALALVGLSTDSTATGHHT